VELRRLRAIDWATGFFGAALIGLLWAPWYRAATSAGRSSFNAWQAMSVNDVILFIAGLTGIAVVALTAAYSTSAMSMGAAVFATWLGLIAAVLAVIRLIFPPDLGPGPTGRQAGVWLGAAAAIGLAISAAFDMRDERRAAPGSYELPITELPAPRVGQEGSGA
jgi:hypothetical protein